jgi:hypothetical protein
MRGERDVPFRAQEPGLKYMRDKPQDTNGAIQVQYGGRTRTQTSIISVDVEWRWRGGSSPRWPNVVAQWRFARATRMWTLQCMGMGVGKGCTGMGVGKGSMGIGVGVGSMGMGVGKAGEEGEHGNGGGEGSGHDEHQNRGKVGRWGRGA